ncbi:hypothetical protein L1D19_20785 [Vibrio natriegens]|uniref:hypothetical protein n=1 Tax=Vibrio natriegens TaxID=691 RepID=UPI001EFE141E|nr:hypothetical protein [Vibrio natriegens]MCG9702509.1 hypothetical protein [Vibrio natriegens]
MLNTTASTQYNDWIGGAAFDDADIDPLSTYAKNHGHIQQNDIIYGFEASYIHVTGEMMVTILYTDIPFDDFKNSGAELSRAEFDLPVNDYFELFKRANFKVARKGV